MCVYFTFFYPFLKLVKTFNMEELKPRKVAFEFFFRPLTDLLLFYEIDATVANQIYNFSAGPESISR